MNLISACIAAFLLTAFLTPCVIRLATACNCLDRPGGRRLHLAITPRWGGLAFFIGVIPPLYLTCSNEVLAPCFFSALLLIGMGMIDDYSSLGWKVKFLVMTVATTVAMFGGNLFIRNIGSYGELGTVELGWLAIPFTYISIIGITNAINLLDGLDGLAAGVSLLAFLFMGIAAVIAANMLVAAICAVFAGALCAFLLYNFPRARIFMGDTGSLFLGFSLAVTAILLTQSPAAPVDAMFPALVLLLPIYDTLRVLLLRVMNGRNPFMADNLHLHHLAVLNSFSPAKATLLFWALTAAFGGVALSLINETSISYLSFVLYASSILSLVAAGLSQRLETAGKAVTIRLHAGQDRI